MESFETATNMRGGKGQCHVMNNEQRTQITDNNRGDGDSVMGMTRLACVDLAIYLIPR